MEKTTVCMWRSLMRKQTLFLVLIAGDQRILILKSRLRMFKSFIELTALLRELKMLNQMEQILGPPQNKTKRLNHYLLSRSNLCKMWKEELKMTFLGEHSAI